VAKRRSHELPRDLEAVLAHGLSVRRKKASSPPQVYRLHLSLLETEPLIWRRLQVPANITLRRLHDVFQVAMGWTDSHLHEFTVDGQHIGMTEPEAEPPATLRDDRRTTLEEIAPGAGSEFTYNYDFGDDWNHRVVIESIDNAGAAAARALCLDGTGACPPEDCGGPHAYEHLLKLLNGPRRPSNEADREILEWLGGDFDPAEFDLEVVNEQLGKLRLVSDHRAPAARPSGRKPR
jgi:hypothetical protein